MTDAMTDATIPSWLLEKLNPAQMQAVQKLEGPLLLLAGAGSGKTRVLTHRMAALIASGRASPEEILCVTFTNKAAREMESRIYNLLSQMDVFIRTPLWVSTFHSFCVRILREHIELLGYRKFFNIYDSSDQLSLIKKTLVSLNINEKNYPPKNFQARISNAKMMGLGPDEFEKHPHFRVDAKTIDVYRRYEEGLRQANALDFDDLLLKTFELFRMYPDILENYQNQFRFIMVDEYQDTNHIQYLLVKLLASKNRNLCVVGDEDQSIYSWRGADISNILNFEKDFTEAQVIKLEQNYRSTKTIVTSANYLIRNNTQRKEKNLFTDNQNGEPITIREELNEYDEARYVVRTIQSIVNGGRGKYADVAIFYRTNAQSRVLEEQLRMQSIPYRLVGGMRFYERMEIKDVVSYMKTSINRSDDVALKRIINVPVRGIGKTTVDRLEEIASQKRISLFAAIEAAIQEREFNAGTSGKLRRFVDLILDLESLAQTHGLEDFYHMLLDRTEYLNHIKKDDSPEAKSRVENLNEFDNAIAQFCKERSKEASLVSFLEEMALVSDADDIDQEVNSVTLMTLHVSKGLEFPFVFIVGMEENLFPSVRGEGSDMDDQIEEERRLAYVGITRAREQLWLTHTKMRRVWGQEQFFPPSRFLSELPKEMTQRQSASLGRSNQGEGFVSRFRQRDQNFDDHFENDSFESRSNSAFQSSFKKRSAGQDSDHEQSFPDYENDSAGSGEFKKGMRVRHPTFGVGSIYSTEGSGSDQRVSVIFGDHTIKKFVTKYARLERV